MFFSVLVITVALVLIVGVAGLVLAYVAYPHRGRKIPNALWLSDALEGLRDAVPSPLEDDDVDYDTGGEPDVMEARRRSFEPGDVGETGEQQTGSA